MILTIIVLNFHFRGPKKKRVPRWLRKYVIGYFGRIFCFGYESKQFIFREKQEKDSKIKKETKSSKVTLLSRLKSRKSAEKSDSDSLNQDNEDYLNSQSEPAYLKANHRLNLSKATLEKNDYNLKENRIILEYSNNNSTFNSAIHKINSFKLNNNNNNNGEAQTSTLRSKESNNDADQQQFSGEISQNLEKLLVKMQKSFDPFKLQDENLKFAILKEILECQRLLLSSSLTQKQGNQLTINEIYDEWKILAMIVDRICFFVYLAALFVSTGLFFLRENVYNDL